MAGLGISGIIGRRIFWIGMAAAAGALAFESVRWKMGLLVFDH